MQLVKFSVVGRTGYVVNLAVYTALVERAGVHYIRCGTRVLRRGHEQLPLEPALDLRGRLTATWASRPLAS